MKINIPKKNDTKKKKKNKPERSIFLAENLTIVDGNGGTVPLIVLSFFKKNQKSKKKNQKFTQRKKTILIDDLKLWN